jgi:translation initiation factor 2 beta subunit (eIF-2beta)/eIF-5
VKVKNIGVKPLLKKERKITIFPKLSKKFYSQSFGIKNPSHNRTHSKTNSYFFKNQRNSLSYDFQ